MVENVEDKVSKGRGEVLEGENRKKIDE